MKPTIDILLATYNGSKYLEEQLDSILKQTYPSFRIIVSDDGSQDATYEILRKYRETDKRIELLPPQKNGGVIKNFSRLIDHAQAEYIMLADQDDVWHPNKVESTLAVMQELESQHGKNLPLLVHTNLTVVDQFLNLIHPSLWRYSRLNCKKHLTLNRLLVQNVVTGCTLMVNKPLAKMATAIPNEAMMHDWWLALIGSAFGKVGILPTSTMLYRRHPCTVTQPSNLFRKLKKAVGFCNMEQSKDKRREQAEAFRQRFGAILEPEAIKMLDAFIVNYFDGSYFKRNMAIFKHGFYRAYWLATLAEILLPVKTCKKKKSNTCNGKQ